MTNPRRVTSCAAFLVATVVTAATGAEATVLCGKLNSATGHVRDGSSLHVRSACKTSEVQLDAAALGLQVLGTLAVRMGNAVSTSGSLSTPANCNSGEVATGGGLIGTAADGGEIAVRSSRPQPETAGATPTGWRVSAGNLNVPTGTITATAYVVCAAP
jgi:hypothetical protein